MSLGYSISAVAARTVTVAVTGRSSFGAELQLATDETFSFGAFPYFPAPAGSSFTLPGINPGTTYFLRGRNILNAQGVREDWQPLESFRTPSAGGWADETSQVRIEKAIIAKPAPVLSLVASAHFANFPVDNLIDPNPTAWRNNQGSNASDRHSLLAGIGAQPIDTIALLQTNLPENVTINVAAYADATAASNGTVSFQQSFPNARASQGVPGRPGWHCLMRLSSPQTYRFWRLGIAAEIPGGVLHAEHVVFGLNQATKNHALDRKETPLDLGDLSRTRSGLRDRQVGLKMRRHEFDIAMLDENEFQKNYADLWRQTNEMMLVVPNGKAGPYLHDRIAYGDFVGGGMTQPASIRYTRGFVVESFI